MARIVTRVLTAVALFLPAPATTQSSKPSVDEALEVVRIWLDAQVDYESLPAISAAIVHDQELVWSGAVGMADLEDARAASSSTQDTGNSTNPRGS